MKTDRVVSDGIVVHVFFSTVQNTLTLLGVPPLGVAIRTQWAKMAIFNLREMPFGQLIFRKIIKIVAGGQILGLKCTKF